MKGEVGTVDGLEKDRKISELLQYFVEEPLVFGKKAEKI